MKETTTYLDTWKVIFSQGLERVHSIIGSFKVGNLFDADAQLSVRDDSVREESVFDVVEG